MPSVAERSLLCSIALLCGIVLLLVIVCLAFGVLGKSLPDQSVTLAEQTWYEGKDLKLVHVVSLI